MKVALLGNGKTGQEVIKLLNQSKVEVFNTKNLPTKENLKGFDIIISFLPGTPFLKLIPLLIDSNIPVVTGSTGFIWPKDINERLKIKNLKWIYASNFSLGMNIISEMIKKIKNIKMLTNEYEFKLKETHHTKKFDAPSGTATEWKNWLEEDIEIESLRVGDTVGIHQLELKLSFETITLKHDATDRAIFAKGAIYAAKKLLNSSSIECGLNHFNEIILKEMR